MTAVHTLLISPAKPGRFDARLAGSDQYLVEGSRTPFLDAARALLAAGLAAPDDMLVMRNAGSAHDALRARIGAAAKLTVNEDGPRFANHDPDRLARFRTGAAETPNSSPPMRPAAQGVPEAQL
jgi:hypothetical protein